MTFYSNILSYYHHGSCHEPLRYRHGGCFFGTYMHESQICHNSALQAPQHGDQFAHLCLCFLHECTHNQCHISDSITHECMSHVTTSTLTTPSWLHCATHGTICPSAQGTRCTWIILEHTLRCKKPRWEVLTVWSVCVDQKSDQNTHVCYTLVHATITGLQTQNGCTMPHYVPLLYVCLGSWWPLCHIPI